VTGGNGAMIIGLADRGISFFSEPFSTVGAA
jgi:hypothetical protein